MNDDTDNALGKLLSEIVGSLVTVWAALLSYSVNKSVAWAMFHSLFGLLYVIYHWTVHGLGTL